MPRTIGSVDERRCSLPETLACLDAAGFDPRDEASVDHAAACLRRLGNDSEFLGDLLVAQIADADGHDGIESGYGPQAFVLSDSRNGYFLRANIWPAEGDHAFRTSGARSFVYGLPHDHNFDFLTVGYFGPGYLSDYFEYDYSQVAGWSGEAAHLRFAERSALAPGRLVHYRAHRDVHRQLPPESLSVSLNVVAAEPASGWFDQYGFDVDADTVTGVLNPTSTEAFLRIAVGLGGAEALDLAERFGRHHPSDRLRLACFEARAAGTGRAAEAETVWREAERCGSVLVAREAGLRLADLVG